MGKIGAQALRPAVVEQFLNAANWPAVGGAETGQRIGGVEQFGRGRTGSGEILIGFAIEPHHSRARRLARQPDTAQQRTIAAVFRQA